MHRADGRRRHPHCRHDCQFKLCMHFVRHRIWYLPLAKALVWFAVRRMCATSRVYRTRRTFSSSPPSNLFDFYLRSMPAAHKLTHRKETICSKADIECIYSSNKYVRTVQAHVNSYKFFRILKDQIEVNKWRI